MTGERTGFWLNILFRGDLSTYTLHFSAILYMFSLVTHFLGKHYLRHDRHCVDRLFRNYL